MKFDLKTILILFLLVFSTILGLMWFFESADGSKQRVKQLESEYKKLQADKKDLDAKILIWQEKFNAADAKDKQLTAEIARSKSDAKLADEKAKRSKVDLDKVLSGIAENRKKIEDLKKNPPTLTDDELMSSLIKKTN